MPPSETRTCAAATALAFVLATLAVPVLHLVFHELSHDHDGGGIHYHAVPPAEDHEHGHDHDAGHDPQPLDPDHGEGSAAHFSLALNDAPAAAIDLAFLGLAEQGRVPRRRDVFRAPADISVPRLRGPPVS